MNETAAHGTAWLALAVALFAGWHTARNQQFSNPLFYGVALLEVALVALLVHGCVALAGTSRDVDGVLLVSYLVAMVLVPPVAVLWGIAEKSRWGTGVVLVALLTISVLCVRVLQIWRGIGV